MNKSNLKYKTFTFTILKLLWLLLLLICPAHISCADQADITSTADISDRAGLLDIQDPTGQTRTGATTPQDQEVSVTGLQTSFS